MTPSTDFTTLGRLGTATGGASSRRRRARHAPVVRRAVGLRPTRLLGVTAALVLVIMLFIAASIGDDGVLTAAVSSPVLDPGLEASLRSGDATLVQTGSMSLTPGGGSGLSTVVAPPAFAAVDDVAIHLPLARPEAVVFLEADSPAAIPMVPIGRLTANDNPEGFAAPADFDGPDYRVAAALSGVRPATGMAALLTAPGTPLLAPVQGVVTTVQEYTAADGTTDWKVCLQPVNRPDLQVVVRRITTPYVTPGQEVTVGLTEIGAVRGGVVLPAADNPLSLPAALVHVRPATLQESEGALRTGAAG